MNFAFCEWELFYPLATKQYTVLFLPNSHVNLEPRVSCALHNSLPRAKGEKRQKRQGLDVLAVFPIPPCAISCTHLPLQGRQRGILILFGVVYPLYRQYEMAVQMNSHFFILIRFSTHHKAYQVTIVHWRGLLTAGRWL